MTSFGGGDQFAQFKQTYFEECAELLADMEQRLSTLQAGSHDTEDLHAIFRTVHSIKAGAGAFSFTALVGFSHQFEALLDCLRQDRISLTDEVVDVLFRASDILADMVKAAQEEVELEDGFGGEVLAMVEQLLDATGAATKSPAAAEVSSGEAGALASYRIRFTPQADLLRHANEPALLIRELKTLGEVSIEIDTSKLPALHKLEPEDAYFAWCFELTSACGEEAIVEVFEFVEDDCDLAIEVIALADEEESGAVGDGPTAPGLTAPVKPAPEGAANPASTSKAMSIRVDLERVDRLVNMVGELVITQAMLGQHIDSLSADQNAGLIQGLEELALHTRELQESVMAIRMQPVKSVFARMPRLVRDLSSKLGKKVRLVTAGENTEVDKTVVEELADPLTHMIRNSLDHGFETPEGREAAGKPLEGTVTLSAEHRGGRIVIEVADDGKGIDREVVLRKAIERGVVPDSASPSDEEIDNFIFLPGFSTAQEVTDVSGRGVGMDVVRRNVMTLGGRISVSSEPGKGTRFSLALPLTLAVLDGMIVAVGDHKYVIPLNSIIESIRPEEKDLNQLVNGVRVVQMRGEYIRLVTLATIFDIPGAIHDPSRGLVVFVETDGGGTIGIVVDELLGQQQVVIKSLEENYDPIDGISAATILGNGKVCLILDIDSLESMDRKVAGNALTPASPESRDPQDGGSLEARPSAEPDGAADPDDAVVPAAVPNPREQTDQSEQESCS